MFQERKNDGLFSVNKTSKVKSFQLKSKNQFSAKVLLDINATSSVFYAICLYCKNMLSSCQNSFQFSMIKVN